MVKYKTCSQHIWDSVWDQFIPLYFYILYFLYILLLLICLQQKVNYWV